MKTLISCSLAFWLLAGPCIAQPGSITHILSKKIDTIILKNNIHFESDILIVIERCIPEYEESNKLRKSYIIELQNELNHELKTKGKNLRILLSRTSSNSCSEWSSASSRKSDA